MPGVTQLSPEGLAFIERHEGYRSALYNDSRGHATIGFGHLVHRGRVGSVPEIEAPFVRGIDKAHAAVLLAKDSLAAMAGVRTFIHRPLQQHEFDALTSIAFNIGVGAFMRSTLARRVNSNATPDAIEDAWLMWNKPHGILQRRRDEAKLFLEGNYGVGPIV